MPDIIRVIISRRIRWAGHIACMGGKRSGLETWSSRMGWCGL